MKQSHYEFVSYWKIDAPKERTWQAIAEIEKWPHWWRGVKSALAESRNSIGIGSVINFTWEAYLPYQLKFRAVLTEYLLGQRIAISVSGDLIGTGVWSFFEREGETYAKYEWRVRTTKTWMNFLSPIGSGIFHHSHNWVMHNGAVGIGRLLKCRVTDGPELEQYF